MESVKNILIFCNAAIFYEYKNIGILEELYQVLKCIISNFHETRHVSRILMSLSNIDYIDLKSHDVDVEDIIIDVHDLREDISYVLSFEKVKKEEEANKTVS